MLNTNSPKYNYELPKGKAKKENKSQSDSLNKVVHRGPLARKPSLPNGPLQEDREGSSMTLRQKLSQQRALLV